jgi:hypothetical protein
MRTSKNALLNFLKQAAQLPKKKAVMVHHARNSSISNFTHITSTVQNSQRYDVNSNYKQLFATIKTCQNSILIQNKANNQKTHTTVNSSANLKSTTQNKKNVSLLICNAINPSRNPHLSFTKNIIINSHRPNHSLQASLSPRQRFQPTYALQHYKDQLCNYERFEILHYKEIYYVGLRSSKLPMTNDNLPNKGWDDRKGFYQVNTSDHLNYRYEIQSVLGSGSFSVVYKCHDHKLDANVAVKILRNKKKYHHQGHIEVDILKNLSKSQNKESQFIVKFLDCFVFRNHLCIVTELLSTSLYDILKLSDFSVLL